MPVPLGRPSDKSMKPSCRIWTAAIEENGKEMAGLTLRNVAKSYGEVEVIESIDLDIEDGEFVVFVGPSGCGKSTLLRMIAGLEEISGGDVSQSVRHFGQ